MRPRCPLDPVGAAVEKERQLLSDGGVDAGSWLLNEYDKTVVYYCKRLYVNIIYRLTMPVGIRHVQCKLCHVHCHLLFVEIQCMACIDTAYLVLNIWSWDRSALNVMAMLSQMNTEGPLNGPDRRYLLSCRE